MPGGTQEVIEDLEDGANVPTRSPTAILAVRMQSAFNKGGE